MRRRRLPPKPPEPPEGYMWFENRIELISEVERMSRIWLSSFPYPKWNVDPSYNWRITKGKKQPEEK